MSYHKTRFKVKDQVKIWRIGVKDSSEKSPLYGSSLLSYDFASRDRVNLQYGKGPIVLHALRTEIGDDHFFRSLQLICQLSFKKKIKANTDDFIMIVNHVTGKDYRAWFDN